jgi:high-affinity Fe2+/Pb2+ permease
MFGFKRNKEAERFYLLPGQGGQAYRRKQKFILKWSIVVGLIVSAVLGALMYYLNKPRP